MEACHAILNYNTDSSTCCSPYTLANRHFQAASCRPNEVALQALKDRRIIQENSRPESLLGRVIHIVIALFECIPLIGIIIAAADKCFFHTPSLSQETAAAATTIQTMNRAELQEESQESRLTRITDDGLAHLHLSQETPATATAIQTLVDRPEQQEEPIENRTNCVGMEEQSSFNERGLDSTQIEDDDLMSLVERLFSETGPSPSELDFIQIENREDLIDIAERHPNLTNLSILDPNITSADLQYLRGLNQLRELYLEECTEITDNGLAHLQDIPLTRLILAECTRITDDGLAHLQRMPLIMLILGGCTRITDDGLAHLQEMPLEELDLKGCTGITDDGLAYLQEMPLTTLNLEGCTRITDNGLAHLQGMSDLIDLDLYQCTGITDAGTAFLRERIPDIQIII